MIFDLSVVKYFMNMRFKTVVEHVFCHKYSSSFRHFSCFPSVFFIRTVFVIIFRIFSVYSYYCMQRACCGEVPGLLKLKQVPGFGNVFAKFY